VSHILSVVTFLPLVGVLFIVLTRGDEAAAARNARWVALWTTLITFAISLFLIWRFDASSADFQFVEKHEWISSFGAHYALGVDGLGLLLVLLTTILTPVVILASWDDADGARWSANSFFALMLTLEGLAIGVFAATDVVSAGGS